MIPGWARSAGTGAALLAALCFLGVAIGRESLAAGAGCLISCVVAAVLWEEGR